MTTKGILLNLDYLGYGNVNEEMNKFIGKKFTMLNFAGIIESIAIDMCKHGIMKPQEIDKFITNKTSSYLQQLKEIEQ